MMAKEDAKEEMKTPPVEKTATEAVAEKVETAEPVVEKAKVVKKSSHPAVLHALDWLLVLVMLGALGYIAYVTNQIFRAPASVSTTTTPTATPLSTALPELQLNQSHQRQGPEVQVNPDLIGRDNPFVNP